MRQVREEAALRQALAAQLPVIAARVGEADGPRLHRELAAFVEDEKRAGRLTLTPEAPTPLGRRLANAADLIGVPLLLLVVSPLVSRRRSVPAPAPAPAREVRSGGAAAPRRCPASPGSRP